MNIGTITGGSEDENFDGVRVDAVDNVNADLSPNCFRLPKLNMVPIEVKISSLSTCLSWKHGLTMTHTTMKTPRCPPANG